jgi:hypothetical protein
VEKCLTRIFTAEAQREGEDIKEKGESGERKGKKIKRYFLFPFFLLFPLFPFGFSLSASRR